MRLILTIDIDLWRDRLTPRPFYVSAWWGRTWFRAGFVGPWWQWPRVSRSTRYGYRRGIEVVVEVAGRCAVVGAKAA